MRRMFDRKELGGDLKPASSTKLGGVKAVGKGEEMTQPIGIDNNGFLWTKESAGGGGIVTIFEGEHNFNINKTLILTEEQVSLIQQCKLVFVEIYHGGIVSGGLDFSQIKGKLIGQYQQGVGINSFQNNFFVKQDNQGIIVHLELTFLPVLKEISLTYLRNYYIDDNTLTTKNLFNINDCKLYGIYGIK